MVMGRSLSGAADAAAIDRLHAIGVELTQETPGHLDRYLLATGERVAVVQIVDDHSVVLQSSVAAPAEPLVDPGSVSSMPSAALHSPREAETRLIAARFIVSGRDYVVIVGAGESTMHRATKLVATGAVVGVPVMALVAGLVTYVLVDRPLRAVRRAQDSQRQFVSDASHELRSPLATITAALELWHAHPELADGAMIGETILPEAHRMDSLLSDLLFLARSDETGTDRASGGLAVRDSDVDLDDVVADEVNRVRGSVGVAVRMQVTPVRVQGDREKLGRAVRNVIDNACRYAGSRVSIEVGREGSFAFVRIADDGPGIPQAERQRIFERFTRLEGDRDRSAGGAGLGLAIVWEVMAAHRGSVVVDDHSPGTVFTLRLPISQSQ